MNEAADDFVVEESQPSPYQRQRQREIVTEKLTFCREIKDREIWPLNAPGMALPGPGLLELARNLGDNSEIQGKGKNAELAVAGKGLKNLVQQILYRPDIRIPATTKSGEKVPLRVVAGHLWGYDVGGPEPAKVMVIGKMLGEEERNQGRNLVGPTGQLLLETCRKFDIKCGSWYVTNLMKTEHPDAASGGRDMKASMVSEWRPILDQELRLVRPQFILCLGADAAKALLGKDASVSKMQGRVVDHTYSVGHTRDEAQETHTARVMVIVHPAAVLAEPREKERFEGGLARFGELVRGGKWDKEEEGLDHRVIDTLADLKKLYFEIHRDCQDNLIGVDAEWQGDHPQNKGSYLRTVQLSWKHKAAACIVLRGQDGKWAFQGAKAKTVRFWVNKICRGRQITGSFFVSDCEWLEHYGYTTIVNAFRTVPKTWQLYMKQFMAHQGPMGFDLAYAMHSVEETASLDLNAMTLRFTAAPRYDIKLDEEKAEYVKENKLKAKDLDGYGFVSNEVIVGVEQKLPKDWGRKAGRPVKASYGCYDADVSRRIAKRLVRLLCVDSFGNNCWESFWNKMRAVPAILEMNTTGLPVDKERMDLLTETYVRAQSRMVEEIRTWARWDKLNLASVQQVREFLFGEKYNGKKKANPDDPPIRIRPEGAKSLFLKPVLTTDKRQMKWDDVLDQGLEKEKTASTGKLALAILMEEAMAVQRKRRDGTTFVQDASDQVRWIRDHRFVGQVLKYTLRPPQWNATGDAYDEDEDGNLIYDKGLPKSICDDGRVRTYLIPTKETGRWASIRPSMQNFTKRREKDYRRILGPEYRWPLRTIIMAPPGYCLVESDYKGAELFVMAVMSGDMVMFDHVMRNQLDEGDPNYYDIHSTIACLAFGLQCAPTKQGLSSIGKKHLRDVAKTVVFGIAYGRGAKAIALAAREEGTHITADEAQQIIDAVFELYPGLQPFFDSCKARIGTWVDRKFSPGPRWLCGIGGDYRRFPVSEDRKLLGDMEREAGNFYIQNAVAYLVNRAVDHLYHYREEHTDIRYFMALQVHDSLMSLVPNECVARYCDEVIPACMSKRVPLYPCATDGMANGNGPYYLGVDTTVFTHWNQVMTPDECRERGISPKRAGWRRKEDGWVHNDFDKKIWRGGKLQDLAV